MMPEAERKEHYRQMALQQEEMDAKRKEEYEKAHRKRLEEKQKEQQKKLDDK